MNKKAIAILSNIYEASEFIQAQVGDLAVLINPPKKVAKKVSKKVAKKTTKKTTKTNKK